MKAQKVSATVWKYWKEHGRHELPWRKTTDPYKILVSEVMLQQTQVERVIPYYKNFLKQFPNVNALAQAPLSEVLKLWQGLGYNRRAKMLHEAAKYILSHQPVYKASENTRLNLVFPGSAAELEKLPGVGSYTAGAVAAFAYNHDEIFIETNIRTVVTHHVFPGEEQVSDAQVREVLERVHPKGNAREWYAALMDYGAHLKRSGVRINARAKGYTKQSAFKGSGREVRGAIVRALTVAPTTRAKLLSLFGEERRAQTEEQI
ncbi:MAG: A/G-specific adenine glycosylase, partial [Patescibacteria group bacterium]